MKLLTTNEGRFGVEKLLILMLTHKSSMIIFFTTYKYKIIQN